MWKKVGSIKPFDNLTNDQLKQELRARGCYEFGKRKDNLVCSLKEILKGVRVPSLLLQNPTQALEEISLKDYTIMDCEPLHDLKGHLSNLFEELPKLLDATLAQDVSAVLHADLGTKETKRGGDYRLTLVHVLALLKRRTPPAPILQLIKTALDISELLYAEDAKRSPKCILRLYNTTWLHFELCSELLSSTSTVSHRRMFGVYLHSITFHAPQQYEIVNLKSTNTEHEERLFGQAKDMVHKATNRQPHNVIPNILLRLQAKQKRGDMYSSYYACSSRISKAHKELNESSANTTVTQDFLTGRMNSWQEHLKRIALFLKPGDGVWWQPVAEGYEFFDGTEEPDTRPEGPPLQHFRDVTLQEIYRMKQSVWQEVYEQNIVLPTPYIKLYSISGEYMGRKTFDETETTVHEDDSDLPSPISDEKDSDELGEDEVVQMEIDGESIQDDMEEECQLEDEEDDVDETNRAETEDNQQAVNEYLVADTCAREQGATERCLRTKFAIALSKVFGMSKNLHKLDKIRYRLKKYTKNTNLVSKHKDLMTSFKLDLQLKLETNKKNLKKYEAEQYSIHHQLPSQTDLHYQELLQNIKFMTKLLGSPDFSG